jgi:hypothetical protein
MLWYCKLFEIMIKKWLQWRRSWKQTTFVQTMKNLGQKSELLPGCSLVSALVTLLTWRFAVSFLCLWSDPDVDFVLCFCGTLQQNIKYGARLCNASLNYGWLNAYTIGLCIAHVFASITGSSDTKGVTNFLGPNWPISATVDQIRDKEKIQQNVM